MQIAHLSARYRPIIRGQEIYISNLIEVCRKAGQVSNVYQFDRGQKAADAVCLPRRPYMACFQLVTVLALMVSNAMAEVDSNSDGISDVWARYYGAEDLVPENDEDGDGMSNAEESTAGTDPFDFNSIPKFTRIEKIKDGLLFRWQAVEGMEYRIESSGSGLEGSWGIARSITATTSGNMLAVIPRPPSPTALFRIAVQSRQIGSDTHEAGFSDDSDGDGHLDLVEFGAGTDPFDAASKLAISEFRLGSALWVDFRTVPGKCYQLQSLRSSGAGGWQNEGAAIIAKGAETSGTLDGGASILLLRISVSDVDSDSDGANDWEELVTGLAPLRQRTRGGLKTDFQVIEELLDEPVRYSLSARRPTAVLRREEPGMFELRRVSGFGSKIVKLSVAGSAISGVDISPLPTAVSIPVGNDSLMLPVTLLPGARHDREVQLALEDSNIADGEDAQAAVRIVFPIAFSVTDFGAIGDGVADDRQAIQSAIDALEAYPEVNTLYFPSGTYRLNSHIASSETTIGTRRILKLGNMDLSGRDLLFLGEEGSLLKSTVSPQRAHMLVAMASFRSLEMRGMTFEKNEVPLAAGNSRGADGVSVVRVGRQKVESVIFDDCIFRNCHGSVMVYGIGYDVRGYLRNLSFTRCQILNPYGANTTNVHNFWGGGVQVGMNAWVGTTSYLDCLFEGGGADMSDYTTSPSGRLKDGGHFGSPMRLEFKNNLVRNMGVEAVYQLNRTLYMGTTAKGFVIPDADGVTPITVDVREDDSAYAPGQILSFRTSTTGTEAGKNNILRVLAWDPETNQLSLLNDGEPGNAPPGTPLGRLLPIYLQADEAGVVDIRDNILDGTLPFGAERSNPSGVTSDTKGVVAGNVILGFASGVLNYKEASVPLFPGTTGLIVEENLIIMRHPDDSQGPVSYGIQTHANDISIVGNTIVCPLSRRSAGIALRGKDARVIENRIIALEQEDNGYASNQRSVGVLVGNTSYGTAVKGNTTQNFDVGVGPEPSQWIIHSVSDHTSINDVLDIDFRGLVDP